MHLSLYIYVYIIYTIYNIYIYQFYTWRPPSKKSLSLQLVQRRVPGRGAREPTSVAQPRPNADSDTLTHGPKCPATGKGVFLLVDVDLYGFILMYVDFMDLY